MAQTMTIVMLKTRAGPEGVWRAGRPVRVPIAQGRQLVDAGYARPLRDTGPPPAETATAEPEAETAMEEPVQSRRPTGTKSRGKARKG